MTTIRAGQTPLPTLTQRDTTTTAGVAQPAQTAQQPAAGAARTAATFQDGFQAARAAAPVALNAQQPLREVLPQHAAAEPKKGEAMSAAGLDRVMNHLQQTFGRALTGPEYNAWRAEAEKMSKNGGTEDQLWGDLFTKLNSASKATGQGQAVLPTAAGAEPKKGEAMSAAGLDRVMNHLQQTFGRALTGPEYNAWRAEAEKMSKNGGTEDQLWGDLFTKLNSASKATGQGQAVLPTAAGAEPKKGEAMSAAGLDRVMNHLQQTFGRALTGPEYNAWRAEAEKMSKEGATEDQLWGDLFTKLNSASKATGQGQAVLPTAAGAEPKKGEAMSAAGLDRVMNHLQQTFGRALTGPEYNAWRAEAEKMSKEGATEDQLWGDLFTKLNSASKATGQGQAVLPTAAGAEPKKGEAMSAAGLDRVMNHLQQTFGRALTGPEYNAWRAEAEKMSKNGGTEDQLWGDLFTKLNSASKATGQGQAVLPTAAGAEPKKGEAMSAAGLDRVMNHLQQTFGRAFTPNEYTAWRAEAEKMSKNGGTEDQLWGDLFTKLNAANKNVNGG